MGWRVFAGRWRSARRWLLQLKAQRSALGSCTVACGIWPNAAVGLSRHFRPRQTSPCGRPCKTRVLPGRGRARSAQRHRRDTASPLSRKARRRTLRKREQSKGTATWKKRRAPWKRAGNRCSGLVGLSAFCLGVPRIRGTPSAAFTLLMEHVWQLQAASRNGWTECGLRHALLEAWSTTGQAPSLACSFALHARRRRLGKTQQAGSWPARWGCACRHIRSVHGLCKHSTMMALRTDNHWPAPAV
jgi:hypothetical protein